MVVPINCSRVHEVKIIEAADCYMTIKIHWVYVYIVIVFYCVYYIIYCIYSNISAKFVLRYYYVMQLCRTAYLSLGIIQMHVAPNTVYLNEWGTLLGNN